MTFVPKCVKDCGFGSKPLKEIETRFEGKTDGPEVIYLKFPQILSCIYCSIAIEMDVMCSVYPNLYLILRKILVLRYNPLETLFTAMR